MSRLHLLLISATIIALSGCATTGGPMGPMESGPPPPFTAEAIREANPPGTLLRFRRQRGQGIPVIREMLFVSGNETETTVRSREVTEKGGLLQDPVELTSLWTELRDHAAFPPEKTERTRSRCTVEAGRFQTWLYLVQVEEPDGTTAVRRFHFALDRPGPPVLLESVQGGEVQMRMELIGDTRGR